MDSSEEAKKLWVPDAKDVWRLATVVTSTDSDAVVLSADGLSESTVKVDDTAIYDISHSLPLDDLSRYNNLHEAPLLMGLKSRFSSNNIYTHCGDVLLSINPYQDIPNLYTLDKTPETSPTDEDEDDDDDDDEANPPHVYTIAKQALNAIMVKDNKNQSIVISGESGAGKTEASKHVMRWLLNESSKLDSSTDASIQTRLMQSNVILEAFGNAKTVRNDNSSRFGKYIKMKYDSKNTIIGAKTDHFLLEKSRLVNVAKGERNYHIFYQMASGLPEEEKAKLNLLPAKSYKMLNQGKTLTVASVDDSAEFSETCEAMKTLGITVAEQKNLFEILSGLLQLGNVEFKPKADGSNGVEPSFKESEFSIKSVAGLLGVEMSEFVIRMTENRSISARGSITAIPLDERKASNNARALVKYVYGMLFEYIVDKINKSHATSEEQPADSFVGILDIFGFEIFKANSFEQLCINYANEKLQQQFNQVVFVLEKQAYEKEGIDSSVIKFEDNQPVIDLISKKPSGLFCMLEEHCLMSREPNNQALLHSFYSTHDKHESFSKPRFGDESFVVKHFAGSVEYLAANFIEKNNDSLTDELLDLTKFSKNELLATVMSDKEVEEGDEFDQLPDAPRESMGPRGSMMGQRRSTGKAGGRGLAALNTVSFVFRSQLEKLTEALRATTPHYIKCIKPNSVKAPGGFSNQLVIDQLRYSGVLEVVRIRREGFPTRMAYTEFHQKYEILLRGNKDAKPSAGASEEESRAATLLICQKALAEENYQLGKTCLFLRDMMLQELAQTVKDFYASKATMIISRFRVRLAVKKYKKAKASASQLEAFARMLRKKKQFKQEKALMTKIQAHVRGRLERVGYGKKLREETNAVTKIASARRMMLEHRDYLKTLESVKKIETVFRMHHQQQEFQDSKQKAIAVQAAFRGYQAQKDLSTKLVSAARLQICIRAFVANSRLDTKLIDLHAFARDNNSEKLKAMLAKEPELKDMRYRFDHFKTLLQTTCKAGHLGLAQILDPSFDEVLKKDGLGNSALHYAAGSGNIDLVKHLSSVVNAAAMLDAKDHKVGLKKALRRLRTKTSGAVELSERSDEVLMSGWLQKHKVGKKMDTRWCVLTRHELKYYKRKSDKIPTKTLSLEVAMVKHSVAADHTFEFLSPFLLDSKKNPHGRMDFTAESEVVLQKWLAALRVSDAMTEMLVQTATGAAVEKSYVSNSALRTFVRQLNNMGQTPLHVLASTKKSKFATIDSQGRLPSGSGARKRLSTAHYIRQETRLGGLTLSDIVRVVGVAAYLIEAGVDIDTKDKDGNTALRFAVVNKNLELATALVKKGADLSAKGADGQSALDLLNSTDVEELASVGNLAISGDLPPLKAAPPKVAGCSYLSFKVGKLCLMDLEDEENTYLKFTVHVRDPSGNCEVAEEPAAIPMPISESVEFLFWGGTFHLQSSLEDLKGAFAVLELCSRKEKNNTIAWCKLDLNVATINSGDVSLEMYSGDVDLKGDATEYEAADMVLNAEVVLTKKE